MKETDDNEKTERILANAVAFAEAKAKEFAESTITKKGWAVKYFESVSPDLIKKYGTALNDMIVRKAQQLEKDGYAKPEQAATQAPVQEVK